MRAAGIKTLRTFIWSMHDASGQSWGVVSSAGGGLGATETKNLINLVSDARRLGFVRLNVAFSPQWTNDPIGYPENHYDPSLFDENWQLIRYVRGIVKQYGPLDSRFDLLNEGAPSDYGATKTQLEDYDEHENARASHRPPSLRFIPLDKDPTRWRGEVARLGKCSGMTPDRTSLGDSDSSGSGPGAGTAKSGKRRRLAVHLF
jgi:hypothetical protein